MSIEVVDYHPQWPAMFEQERQALARVAGPWLCGAIEHVGSTAVPGLAAKPVLDIMFGIESLAAAQPAIEALASLDYCYFPYKAELMHWFCKPSPEHRTHHLHLVPFSSPLWQERLAFRDALRADTDLAEQYASLKRQLAALHSQDREAYTQQKWPFIEAVLKSKASVLTIPK